MRQDLTIGQKVVVRRAKARAMALCQLVVQSKDEELGPIVQSLNLRPATSRLNGLRSEFERIGTALSNLNINHVQYDDQEKCFAYVYPTDPTVMVLGNQYFTAERNGVDSVPGVLIHEASHWQIVRGTDDHAYGDDIYTLSSTLMRNNADTIERIAEAFDK
ncbi:MAG: hypothetical protein F6K23_04730 [Okeania sp. SIO2C9]|uniref:M35 family metallo-endopeptidase n=1 Tax=Okeania sp. SIO2C9 TaxID=2607791 RepID=UPI0013C147E7|nr:M35 family metallo-endopeptidase [Okeania sp. SIO2C9]NEQ72439.1 hypothetical protein [Okeania sp. SIO2C9]